MENKRDQLDIYLAEYEKLKDEQIARIGFRDNLLYVSLGLFGAILSFVASSDSGFYGILVIPLVCIVLGWTYLANDEKITAISLYIQIEMTQSISVLTSSSGNFFHWEKFNRSTKGRKRRKTNQFIVNELAFVLSGIFSLVIFLCLQEPITHPMYAIASLEFIFLITLGIEFFLYADFFDSKGG